MIIHTHIYTYHNLFACMLRDPTLAICLRDQILAGWLSPRQLLFWDTRPRLLKSMGQSWNQLVDVVFEATEIFGLGVAQNGRRKPNFFYSSNMGVSKNRGTPKSSILIGFSIINHPFSGTPIFGNTHIDCLLLLP